MKELLRQLWAAQSRVKRPEGGDADTVYMHGVITDETNQDQYLKYFNEKRTISVASVLKQLGEITAHTVRLHINSPGGNYFEGVAIRDALMADGRPMVATGAGMVGSAATLPFLSAGERELSDGGLSSYMSPRRFCLPTVRPASWRRKQTSWCAACVRWRIRWLASIRPRRLGRSP